MPRQRDPSVTGRVLLDVVDSVVNSIPVSVSYENKPVVSGVELRPSAVCNPPRVQIGGADFRSFYTLVMVDPDAPTPTNPTKREYLHWMVTDIPETTTDNFGTEVVPYESPEPTVGIHRVVFVLFRQVSRPVAQAAILDLEGRENFSTRRFAASHGFGLPAAVVYFNCQRERGTGGRRFT